MSTFFQWDPSVYSVSVDKMDREHEVLIEIMNRLHARYSAGAATAELSGIVQELVDYTVLHFEHEEAHMESVGYPGLGSHKLIHKDLLEKFGKHVDAFRTSGALTEDFFLFLRRWLAAHIKGIDRKYGEHGKLAKPA